MLEALPLGRSSTAGAIGVRRGNVMGVPEAVPRCCLHRWLARRILLGGCTYTVAIKHVDGVVGSGPLVLERLFVPAALLLGALVLQQ